MGGRTSSKRRNRARRHKSNAGSSSASGAPHVARVLEFDGHAITSGLGYDLLSRAGWVAGTSLGADQSRAAAQPIPIVVRASRAGLGCSPVSPASPPPPPASRTTRPAAEREFEVYDPLRPRCRHDPSHVVASLKALQKHEANCPANPRNRRVPAASAPVRLSASWLAMHSAELEEDEDDFEDLSSLSGSDDSDLDLDLHELGLGLGGLSADS